MSGILIDCLLTDFDVDLEPFAQYRVPSGTRLIVPTHHTTGVFYVLAGTMHLGVAGQAPILCRAGSLVIVPPRQKLAIAADAKPTYAKSATDIGGSTRDGLLLFDAGIGGESDLCVVSATIAARATCTFTPLQGLDRPILVAPARGAFIRHSYRAMLEEIAGGGLGSSALVASLMKACLLLLMRQHAASGGRFDGLASGVRDPRLSQAVEAIVHRPAARHSVASLAQLAGMSRSAFAREFSVQVMISPMAFVARTRLHRAVDLLSTTKLPVKEIATAVGFASRSHFCRAFSATYGVVPSASRARSAAQPSRSARQSRGMRA